ncbi:TonB-dependent receptor [Flavisolibacter ginsenosidimutans]|uniref:TonB-dependent receptor n=1 Tax=Flavisolibacter ginsenosidimutans TaxID=661481 RepID=A0A5B8UED3_9BACT|nr:TonB-dependent receptor [Flavisolibacter ginsenosidimutans]QEC55041.1 TonB-dependent receptor [Flavisolibacter ginsenosidimutans]
MKQILCVAAFVATCLFAKAQNIKGRVTDAATNTPLSGATVIYAGKKIVTDNNGTFTLECGKAQSLSVSYVGYTAAQKTIGDCGEELFVALQPTAQTLDRVEITATSNQNKALLYQPNSITKLSPVELKRSTGLFLDDAILQNVPGVTMSRRSVSGGQQFNIRGYGNGSRGTRGISSNFDGQGYKVYLNGIPVTDAEGITTLDDIDFGSIGNVEVVKGPSGTLYGLAIAGVVNLHTIRPEKGKTYVSQEALVGNYNLQRYTTQFATAGERSSLLLNYGNQKTEGYTIHDNSRKSFVNAVAEFTPNAKQTINTYFGYSNSYDQRSGELTIQQWDANDFSGNPEYIKRNAHSNVYTFRAGAEHTYQFNNNLSNTTSIFGTSFTSNVSSAGGWTDKLALNIGLRSTFDTKFAVGNGATLSGTTGVETQRQNAQTIGYGMIDPLGATHVWRYGDPYFIIGSTAAGANGTTSNVYSITATSSLFTEWTLALPSDFSITAGLGWSNMKVALDDRIYSAATPNKPTHYDTTYYPGLSPRVALNKVFSKEFSVYASYNRAYKAPVSSFFYIPYAATASSETGVVNSHLKPETGDQFEIGTKGSLLKGKLNYQLALFEAIFSDKFSNKNVVNAAGTATLYSYVFNGGKQTHKGIEALLKSTVYQSSTGFVSAIMPFANVTYSDFKYDDYPFSTTLSTVVNYKGNRVAGVSKWVTSAGFDFTTKPGLYGNLAYTYRDPFPLTSDGLANGVPYHVTSYSLLNAKLGYRHSLSRHFDLDASFGVNNIAGIKYPIMVFVNQIPDAYMVGPTEAVYFGTVNLKYNF